MNVFGLADAGQGTALARALGNGPNARRLRSVGLTPLLACALAPACSRPDVVVYCAHDQVHAEPILQRFERETGLDVSAEFDVEASKTVGLVARLRAEAARTRCDVFWNNEAAHTAALAEEGLLAAYDSPSAAGIPEQYRDPARRWTGFAARARILLVNTALADPRELHGLQDLLDPRWAGRAALARPLAGTTLTHVAALYQALGEAPARAWIERVAALNQSGALNLASGNGQAAKLVASGACALAFTDTDDAAAVLAERHPVAVVWPDQEPDAPGALLIPNTVAILAGAPHPETARQLVDFLLAPEVERELAFSRAAQIPLRAGVPRPPEVRLLDGLRLMPVDWVRLGREISARERELRELFLR
jgi:iron(III) transport system substrate-binding protein